MAQEWARRKEDEIVHDIHIGTRRAERITIAELLARYEREITPRKRSEASDRSRLKTLTAHLGYLTLAALTPEDVVEYVDERLEVVSASTARKEVNVLSNALKLARALWRIPLPENAAATAREILTATRTLGRCDVPRDRRLHGNELNTLVDASPPLMRSLIPFAVETAMRRGEISNMRLSHLQDGLLSIPHNKTDKPRTIPLSKRAQGILRKVPKRDDGYVWNMRPDSITRAFTRARKRTGITDLRFHDLRHEGTSRLFEKGLSIEEVASITGHSDWRMLKRYTHLSPRKLGKKLG